jgi:hypothetical protein
MVYEWVVGKQTLVFFSPDDRALIIARGDAFSFWDVETLRLTRCLRRDFAQFPGWVAFSSDGRLMALEMAPAVIHLREVATGRTVAKFADPHGDRATWQGFTPDGTQLVVLAGHSRAIHIWDLRAIRARLKDMNLDWDWAEFPPATAEESVAEPLSVEVFAGELSETWPRYPVKARHAIIRSLREAGVPAPAHDYHDRDVRSDQSHWRLGAWRLGVLKSIRTKAEQVLGVHPPRNRDPGPKSG